MATPSSISITLDGVDITDKVIYHETSFQSQANPVSGTFKISVKDVDQTLAPVAGQKVALIIDGVPLFGGYVMQIGRGVFFPVVDTTSPSTVVRKWILQGPDYNFLFDKRITYDAENFAQALEVPVGQRTVRKAFLYLMENFIDVPAGLDYTTHIDFISAGYGDDEKGSLYVGQGATWRDQMDDFMDHAACMYYIDAEFKLHLHTYETLTMPWLFSDRPTGPTMVGFREGEFSQDFAQIVTDALVWGGSAISTTEGGPGGDIVFARYPDPPANDVTIFPNSNEPIVLTSEKEQDAIVRQASYGRWQMAEERAGQNNYLTLSSVRQRAYAIVNGPTGAVPTHGIESGFNKSLDTMSVTWFGHDVPNADHVRPGYLMDFILYSQGTAGSPFVTTLPLRSMRISFPTLPSDSPGDTFVRFEGEFGVSFSDRRYLWSALRRRQRQLRRSDSIVVVDSSSESIPPHSLATFFPYESPNGTRTDFTFQSSTGSQVIFLVGEFDVFINGLLQRSGLDYLYDSVTGTVTFTLAPASDDQIWVTGAVTSGTTTEPPPPPPPSIGGLPGVVNPIIYEPLIQAAMPMYLGTPHLCTHQSGTTEIARISNTHGRHNNYASICAWNIDMSMLNLGFSNPAIVHGSNYTVLNTSGIASYAFALSWSHVDPNLGFVRANDTDRALARVSITSAGVISELQTLSAASMGHLEADFGGGQGEQDNDDQYIAYSWIDANGDYGIGVWDIPGWQIHAERTMGNTGGDLGDVIDHVFTTQNGGWMSVTFIPSGTGVTQGMWAYEVDLNTTTRTQISDAQQHGDWARTTSGEDRFCYWEYDGARCFDPVTSTTVNMGPDTLPGDTHLSGRSILAPGLIYISNNSVGNTAPGAGQIRAHVVGDPHPSDAYVFGFAHRTQALGYESSAFACPSPDGKRVTFGGPWQTDTALYAYVAGVDTGL